MVKGWRMGVQFVNKRCVAGETKVEHSGVIIEYIIFFKKHNFPSFNLEKSGKREIETRSAQRLPVYFQKFHMVTLFKSRTSFARSPYFTDYPILQSVKSCKHTIIIFSLYQLKSSYPASGGHAVYIYILSMSKGFIFNSLLGYVSLALTFHS